MAQSITSCTASTAFLLLNGLLALFIGNLTLDLTGDVAFEIASIALNLLELLSALLISLALLVHGRKGLIDLIVSRSAVI